MNSIVNLTIGGLQVDCTYEFEEEEPESGPESDCPSPRQFATFAVTDAILQPQGVSIIGLLEELDALEALDDLALNAVLEN
jgi:hypothetical protein